MININSMKCLVFVLVACYGLATNLLLAAIPDSVRNNELNQQLSQLDAMTNISLEVSRASGENHDLANVSTDNIEADSRIASTTNWNDSNSKAHSKQKGTFLSSTFLSSTAPHHLSPGTHYNSNNSVKFSSTNDQFG